jgi:hypothetical protein
MITGFTTEPLDSTCAGLITLGIHRTDTNWVIA